MQGCAGVLAGGLLVLALTLTGVEWWASTRDLRGPGLPTLIGHGIAAVVAVGLVVVGGRSRHVGVLLTGAGVLVTTALVLWFGWYR